MLVIKLKWTPEGLEVISNGTAKRPAKTMSVNVTRLRQQKDRLKDGIAVLRAIQAHHRLTSLEVAKMMGYARHGGGGLGRFSHMLRRAGKRIGINHRDAYVVTRDVRQHETYWIGMSRLDDFIEGLEGLAK